MREIQRLRKGIVTRLHTQLRYAKYAAATAALHQFACPGLRELVDRYGYLAALAPALFYLGHRVALFFLAQPLVKLHMLGIDLTQDLVFLLSVGVGGCHMWSDWNIHPTEGVPMASPEAGSPEDRTDTADTIPSVGSGVIPPDPAERRA